MSPALLLELPVIVWLVTRAMRVPLPDTGW